MRASALGYRQLLKLFMISVAISIPEILFESKSTECSLINSAVKANKNAKPIELINKSLLRILDVLIFSKRFIDSLLLVCKQGIAYD